MHQVANAIRRFERSPLAGVATVVLWCAMLMGTLLYITRLV
ncbi:MAG: hypothetical protein RBS40_13330 [Rhodocyclaceae bacterium]|jgi:hypothetical protein|nr:hypothetical protein [Rhodocyclaceae bacterium]